uniref:LOW QUALITY PROTEIN: ras suppressor protein 1-like n=1 Tax=Callorhinus ursinus TaxID=34884 RepID=A0A3Q7NI77_CALUR|nr:LOW QUALITY PROTEIN: ras suppressor protein 1-like [Callorhinus ursinus]
MSSLSSLFQGLLEAVGWECSDVKVTLVKFYVLATPVIISNIQFLPSCWTVASTPLQLLFPVGQQLSEACCTSWLRDTGCFHLLNIPYQTWRLKDHPGGQGLDASKAPALYYLHQQWLPGASTQVFFARSSCTAPAELKSHTLRFVPGSDSDAIANCSQFDSVLIFEKAFFLPQGFGSLPAPEVLDLTYNNLNENSLPGIFFYLTTLRALHLSDNDFEILPPDIGKLTKLQILSLRDNDLISLPKEIGELTQPKELHIQGNCLAVLPPELGNLDLTGQKQVFKAENNPWVTPIADQFQLSVSHVFEYIRSETYKYLYGRHMQANPEPPKENNDKSKKISRKPLTAKNK